jgi:transcriptional regulator with XRE-family HTH domain
MGDVVRLDEARQKQRRPLMRDALGEVLRRKRLEQGRTIADVAATARVSLPYLSELERGRKEASSEVLGAVCDALQVEVADVLSEVGRSLARRPVTRLRSRGGETLCLAA